MRREDEPAFLAMAMTSVAILNGPDPSFGDLHPFSDYSLTLSSNRPKANEKRLRCHTHYCAKKFSFHCNATCNIIGLPLLVILPGHFLILILRNYSVHHEKGGLLDSATPRSPANSGGLKKTFEKTCLDFKATEVAHVKEAP